MANNGASDYLAQKLLDHCLGTSDFTAPTNVYLAAFYGDPLDTGEEIATGAYARQIVTSFDSASTTASGALASSAVQVVFPEATGNWGTVDYLALFDAKTSGHALWGGPMAVSKVIGTGDQLKIATGAFAVKLNRSS